MLTDRDKTFGRYINRLILKENLTREEIKDAVVTLMDQETTEIQQGAFLAALTSKGETAEEIAGCFEAIYERDTVHVDGEGLFPLVENCGTGMDTLKTFNISTAASILAAAGGIRMARHGARAITSFCGTVDLAEALGVDVECSAGMVFESIKRSNIGLFNGMSTQIHPHALGRILSRISFGSTLNIAASLANPVRPEFGVRGVSSKEMIGPAIRVMKAIGYRRALALYGAVDGSEKGMDEASVCGTTFISELKENGEIEDFSLRPYDVGLSLQKADDLSPGQTIEEEARQFTALIQGRTNGSRKAAAVLNAGLIYYVAGAAPDISSGVSMAARTIHSGMAFNTLEGWVAAQNRNPEKGLETLKRLSI